MAEAVRYEPHARQKMAIRDISTAMVEAVLAKPDRVTPAPTAPGRTQRRSNILWGRVGQRTLKVYVKVGSNPPLVTTVAWKGWNPT